MCFSPWQCPVSCGHRHGENCFGVIVVQRGVHRDVASSDEMIAFLMAIPDDCVPNGQSWKDYLQGRVFDPTFWLHVTSRVSNPERVISVEGHTPPHPFPTQGKKISDKFLTISGNSWLKQKSFRLRNHCSVTCPHSGQDLWSGITSNIQESSRNIFVLKFSKKDSW